MAKKSAKASTKKAARVKKTQEHDAAFVEHYLGSLPRNATQAYKKLHPNASTRTCEVNGSALLRKAEVAAMIEARTREIQEKLQQNTEITKERVLRELGRLAFFDLRKLYKEDGTLKAPHELDDDTAAALASIETEELFEGRGESREHVGTLRKVKAFNKAEAIRDAMKHLGLFEKHNKQVTDPVRELLAAIDGRSKLSPPASN